MDTNKKNKDKLYNIIFAIVFIAIILIVVIGTFRQYQDDQEIKQYNGKTEATIIEFKHINLTAYSLYYEYKVESKRYVGRVGVNRFNCDDGKLGCVGHTFEVSYSTKNPSKSTINLEEYEKEKQTVEF